MIARRIRDACAITRMLTQFESIEKTLDPVVRIAARTLPLQSAILIDGRRSFPGMICWPTGDDRQRVEDAKRHAQNAYAYLSGVNPAAFSELDEDIRAGVLPKNHESRSSAEARDRFISIPLAVSGEPTFGVVQFEGARALDENDLSFANTIANELAIAVRRHGAPSVVEKISERRHTNEEKGFLLDVERALSTSLDTGQALRKLAELAVPRLGDYCVAELFTPHQEGLRTGVPARPTDYRPETELAVPIELEGRQLGSLTFGFTRFGRERSASDRALAAELARRAAFAVENGRLYREAQRSVKVREQILQVVSHDLKNPLHVVLMNASYLKNQTTTALGPSFLDAVQRIHLGAGRMRRMVDDLLDFVSIEAGQLSIHIRSHDPGLIANEAITLFLPVTDEKRVRLTTTIAAGLMDVSCDRDRILQVIFNLLGNALNVVDRTGTIGLEVEPFNESVLFVVSDNGPGIAPAALPHIFERYYRGEEATYSGTGLGLAISRGIIDAHGGRIWAESELGRGSTFYFTLPRSPSASDRSDAS